MWLPLFLTDGYMGFYPGMFLTLVHCISLVFMERIHHYGVVCDIPFSPGLYSLVHPHHLWLDYMSSAW